jgi:predicted small metal-binding protein
MSEKPGPMGSIRRTYKCLEYECDFVAEADTDEDLVATVQKHFSEAHDSMELEDVILAGASHAPSNERK